MRRAAVVAALVLVGCGSGAVTGPEGEGATVEPEVLPAPLPTPTPTPSPTPAPEPGPRYWSAWIDNWGGVHHSNLSGHWQHVVACAYRAGNLAGEHAYDMRPHDAGTVSPIPFDTTSWTPGEVLIFGLVGNGRRCTPHPGTIGNITARRLITWPPTGCLRSEGC